MVGTRGLGAVGPTRSHLEARSAHEPGHAILGGAIALSPQLGRHAGASVTARVTVLMDRSHRFQEEGVFGRAAAIGALERASTAEQQINGFLTEVFVVVCVCFWHGCCPF